MVGGGGVGDDWRGGRNRKTASRFPTEPLAYLKRPRWESAASWPPVGGEKPRTRGGRGGAGTRLGGGGEGPIMEGHSAHSLHSFMSHVMSASHAHRGAIQPRPPFVVTVTLYRDLRASSLRLTFRLLPPLTDNHAPSSGSPLSPPQSSIRPPWRPFPCSPFQNRSPRSLHHPRSVSANMKRCKLLQSGGGAGAFFSA